MTDTVKNTKTIYSKRLAEWLITKGFKLLGTKPNFKKIGFVSFEFEESQELIIAMMEYSALREFTAMNKN